MRQALRLHRRPYVAHLDAERITVVVTVVVTVAVTVAVAAQVGASDEGPAHPLSPLAKPLMTACCRKKNAMRMGAVPMMSPAKMRCHCDTYCPTKE